MMVYIFLWHLMSCSEYEGRAKRPMFIQELRVKKAKTSKDHHRTNIFFPHENQSSIKLILCAFCVWLMLPIMPVIFIDEPLFVFRENFADEQYQSYIDVKEKLVNRSVMMIGLVSSSSESIGES